MNAELRIETGGESRGKCDCCGNETRTVWGYVHECERTIAAYFVQWTVESKKHLPNFDFLIGTWGNDEVNDRVLSSWQYSHENNSFMIIDAAGRPAANSSLCSHPLSRDETLAQQGVKTIATRCLDAVWEQDSRIEEIRGLSNGA